MPRVIVYNCNPQTFNQVASRGCSNVDNSEAAYTLFVIKIIRIFTDARIIAIQHKQVNKLYATLKFITTVLLVTTFFQNPWTLHF